MPFPFISPELYAWVILPLLIFLARIADVSMETVRVIYISRGIKFLAPIIAFFEIIIWLLAMDVVLKDLSNIVYFMAYAFGFAAGTYVGLVIEERLSIGTVILRIITTEESTDTIAAFLMDGHFGVTYLDARGARGNVRMILSLVNRTDLPKITEYIEKANPNAFFSIEDVRYVNQGVFRPKAERTLHGIFNSLVHPHKRK
ncbi:MAG: DUF2179 domain-containing protein [Methanomicrobiales archaeon]|nr:DUF2179 domain-containing protein [Methanomicrobiales archaeon]